MRIQEAQKRTDPMDADLEHCREQENMRRIVALWFLGGQRTVTSPPHRQASWVAKQPRRNLELTATKS